MNDLNSLKFPSCAGNYEWAADLSYWDDLAESLEMLTMCQNMWESRSRGNCISGMLRYSKMVQFWQNEVNIVLFGA